MKVTGYIEPKAVQRAVDRAAPKSLRSAGAYVRAVARNSIRMRKNRNKHSMPGTPPYTHPDSNGLKGLKKTIVFGVTSSKQSVLIGPMYVKGGLANAGRIQEFGGTRMVRSFDADKFERGIRVGDEGPVTMRHFSKRKDSVIRRDTHPDPITGRAVVWVRIRTKTQAAHSTRLFRRMTRKYSASVLAHFPPRPYMGPALKRSTPKLSKFWYNSVRP